MQRIRKTRWGRRIARWPSAAVVGASVLAILLASWLLPRGAAWPVAVAAFAPVLVYASLRTTRRWDPLGTWLAPGAASTLAHDIAGVERWIVALPVLLLGLAVLADDDRQERRARAQSA